MSAPSPDPYEVPKATGASHAGKRRPPIATKDVFLLIGFTTLGWLAMWPVSRDLMRLGPVISIICFYIVIRSVISRRSDHKPELRELPWLVLGFVGSVILVSWLGALELPPRIAWWQQQPAPYLAGWIISCAVLIRIWWKRRKPTSHFSKQWKPAVSDE